MGEQIAPKEAPILRPDSQVHLWSLRYIPQKDGSGQITLTLDEKTQTLTIPQEQRKANATFDHFGMFSHSNKGNHIRIFLDDLTYTVARASRR